MPKSIILLLTILLLGSWFLLAQGKSFMEKLTLIIAVIIIYVAYRLMGGASMYEIIAPLIN